MNMVKTTEQFIEKACIIHDDKYDYSKVEYHSAKTPVTIICPKHGPFEQTPSNHLRGCGCQKCKNENTSKRCRMTNKQFIEKARKIHGDKYDYSLTIFENWNKPVIIICPEHGKVEMNPRSHLIGTGCRFCGFELMRTKLSMTTEEFIRRAREVHGDKYDYSETDLDNRDEKGRVKIICHEKDENGVEHGEFWQRPSYHLKGKGCKKCSIEDVKMTTEEFIRRSKEVHGDKYDYSETVCRGVNKPVIIICPEHGPFEQTPVHHLRGQGCRECGKIKYCKSLTLTTKQFIEKARKIHGDKYDYSLVNYVRHNKKVTVICPEHGPFDVMPMNHCSKYNQNGCPKCQMTLLEMKTMQFLDKNKIKYIYRASKKDLKWLGRQSLDFYLPDYNMAIECQGEQHFIPVDFAGRGNEWAEKELIKNVKNDKIKFKKCFDNSVKVIYFVKNDMHSKCDSIIYQYSNVFKIDEINEKGNCLFT